MTSNANCFEFEPWFVRVFRVARIIIIIRRRRQFRVRIKQILGPIESFLILLSLDERRPAGGGGGGIARAFFDVDVFFVE